MLISGRYSKLLEVGDKTIEECILYCWFDFFKKLEKCCSKKHNEDGTTRMYSIFNYGTEQRFNIDNLIYECTSSDYKEKFEYFYKYYYLDRNNNDDCCYSDSINLNNGFINYNITKSDNIDDSKNNIEVNVKTDSGYNGNLFSYFGSGEFPFLCFKIIRIGKVDYYTYKITR